MLEFGIKINEYFKTQNEPFLTYTCHSWVECKYQILHVYTVISEN